MPDEKHLSPEQQAAINAAAASRSQIPILPNERRPETLSGLKHKASRLPPAQVTRILEEHSGGARGLNNLHPDRYAVGDAFNAALGEPGRRAKEKEDEDGKESEPDGFKDASG
jgi:hypothetical protein